jgi:ribosomal protein L12E/L44/L45/RPP1/RPP2
MLLQADNINTIVKAAGITVEPYWPSLFAKLFSKKSVEDLIANVGAGVSSWLNSSCRGYSSSSNSSSRHIWRHDESPAATAAAAGCRIR